MKLTTLFLLLASPVLSHATAFIFNDTITLNPNLVFQGTGNQSYTQVFSGLPSFVVAAGDSISGTILFNSEMVSIQSAAGHFTDDLAAFFSPASAASMSATTTTSLLGLTIAPGTAAPTPYGSNGGCCIVVGFVPDGLVHNFSFTGFTYSMTLTSVSTGTANLALNQLSMEGDTMSIVVTTPEPSAAYLLFGAGAILLLRRRLRASRGGGSAR